MPTVDYNIIGKYRSQLMGIAILNVLVLHSLGWTEFHHPTWAATALNTFGRLIFTEGFLFLSGYGLYYSLHKNSNLKVFFTKRVKRLLIPYWLMTLPFFMLWLLMGKYGMLGFAQRVSTLYFWFHGNYVGMWYISVSVLLYLCFPLIYRVLQRRGGYFIAFSDCGNHLCPVLSFARLLRYDKYRHCKDSILYHGCMGRQEVDRGWKTECRLDSGACSGLGCIVCKTCM